MIYFTLKRLSHVLFPIQSLIQEYTHHINFIFLIEYLYLIFIAYRRLNKVTF